MKHVIGLDIGGTKMAGIVYDGKAIVRQLIVATPKTIEAFELALEKLLTMLTSGKQISAVGIGIAGIISPNNGQIIYCPNMKFLVGFNPENFFKGKKYRTVKAENDANCFALAESVLGKGKDFKNFIGLTLGTGIGGGIVIHKKLYSGMNGSAGEAGHVMADFKYDSEHYFQMARDKKDFRRMGDVVGLLFTNIINLLDIEAIILGGTVSQRHHKQFLPFALSTARAHVVNKGRFPKVLVSSIKNSGALGAALLVSDPV